MTSLLLDMLPMVFSLIMGVATTLWKQGQEDLHNERMHSLKATENARKDKSRSTSLSRKFIVHSVIGSLFLFPMLLTIMNWLAPLMHAFIYRDLPWLVAYTPIAIYVPKESMHGGLLSMLWNHKEMTYVPITGFVLMPIHILLAEIIGGFYFGASAARR